MIVSRVSSLTKYTPLGSTRIKEFSLMESKTSTASNVIYQYKSDKNYEETETTDTIYRSRQIRFHVNPQKLSDQYFQMLYKTFKAERLNANQKIASWNIPQRITFTYDNIFAKKNNRKVIS